MHPDRQKFHNNYITVLVLSEVNTNVHCISDTQLEATQIKFDFFTVHNSHASMLNMDGTYQQ